ncbi:hypothetical protein ATE84_0470 [Aquimarina sp. MAR_2010_214]|nr:hypothetical protein ATE84_0470 [Aquimarina sp. MAR_2010_214]
MITIYVFSIISQQNQQTFVISLPKTHHVTLSSFHSFYFSFYLYQKLKTLSENFQIGLQYYNRSLYKSISYSTVTDFARFLG